MTCFDNTVYYFRMLTYDNAETDYTDDFLAVINSVRFGGLQRDGYDGASVLLPTDWEVIQENDGDKRWAPNGKGNERVLMLRVEDVDSVTKEAALIVLTRLAETEGYEMVGEPYLTKIAGSEGYRAVYTVDTDGENVVMDAMVMLRDSKFVMLTTVFTEKADDPIFINSIYKSLQM